MRHKTGSRVGRLALVAGLVAGAASALAEGDGLARLKSAYPGVRAMHDGGRVVGVYGKPMTAGINAVDAAEGWLREHGDVWGIADLTLEPLWTADLSQGKFEVFAYRQHMDGLPVEDSLARVLVLNREASRVVYAAGNLAVPPANGFAPDRVSAEQALSSLRDRGVYRFLGGWTEPTKVVFAGLAGQDATPVRAWRITGENSDLTNRVKLTFFVDAATGELVHIRDEVVYEDVVGRVTGMASPGVLPDMQTNPPVEMPIDQIRVSITGGNNAFTGETGDYRISHGGTGQVTVTTQLNGSTSGRWVRIDNVAGGELAMQQNVTPPGPANFLYNPTPSEFDTAQVNAFIHTTITHDFVTDRTSWTGLNTQMLANVNLNSSCNAYYDGNINFYRRSGGCNNTAYTTVVAHEYGHHIVNRLGLSQGAFGEGFSDVTAQMIYDDYIVGRYFRENGGFVRDNRNSRRQYPCSGGVHFCGQMLGGCWWWIREYMGNTYGSQLGLEMGQQLFVDWMLITRGGQGENSAHPTTAIEVLTVDDDDGDIGNGTPNYLLIRDAFALHNIPTPPLDLIKFAYPDGRPAVVQPDRSAEFRVDVLPVGGQPVPGSGTITFRIDGGSWTTVDMREDSPNRYTAALPAAPCGSTIDYYVAADDVGGLTFTDPEDAPNSLFSALSADGVTIVADFNFETAPGWTVQNQNLTDGAWERGVPVGGGGRGDPPTDYDGSGQCWLTANRSGNSDVDGGPTRLISPTFDLSATVDPTLSYARWFYNDDRDIDRLDVDISSDGGSTWVRVESVPHVDGWVEVSVRIADFIPLTNRVVVRFSATDNPNDSVTEAAVDAFRIQDVVCDEGCYADCDGNSTLDIRDFFCFQAKFAGQDPYADCDGNSVFDIRDFFCFQSQYAGGCR